MGFLLNEALTEKKMKNKVKSRNDHHMLLALLTAQRSPDPNTQVGCCIVDEHNRVVGLGYNGLPRGINTDSINWARKNEDPLDTKYPYVVHAENNAIFNATKPVVGCKLYVTMYPCNECAKDIIQSGITSVRYLSNPYKDGWQVKCSDTMFKHLDLDIQQHKWSRSDLIESYLQDLCLTVSS
jgi:dCMP deaminase